MKGSKKKYAFLKLRFVNAQFHFEVHKINLEKEVMIPLSSVQLTELENNINKKNVFRSIYNLARNKTLLLLSQS
jgi:hypothetical protein